MMHVLPVTWVGEKNETMKESSQKLGILAFEAAKTMSRLLSLYKSLSEEEISRLRNDVIKSQGVAFLNSRDEDFHLSLACAERLGDLDRVASSVSRMGKKCTDPGLNRFDDAYSEPKIFGIIDLGSNSEYGSRVIKKKVQKMEKLVATTSRLHAALETLTEMEASRRNVLKQRSSQKKSRFDRFEDNASLGLFYQRVEDQREKVGHLREVSLWSRTFDESVYLMARIVCVVYARICAVFGQYIVSENPLQQREFSLIQSIRKLLLLPQYSGPLSARSKSNMAHRFCSPRSIIFPNDNDDDDVEDCDHHHHKRAFSNTNRIIHAAEASTLGGSGLALRYANVILLAEKYLYASENIDHYERESLYQMLPESLKALVRAKLRKNMKSKEDDDWLLAKGWRDAVMEIMGWLSPVEHDTVKWHMERNYEKVKFDAKPSSVLLLQTLHFADREKTEAAIAEVLVGLSCIYIFENRRLGT